MAATIEQMQAAVARLRDQLERTAVNGEVKELEALLVRAERRLAQELTMFRGLTTRNGHLVKSVANIEHAGRVVERAQKAIQAYLVKPGHEWADSMVAAMQAAGEQLARANLSVPWISQDVVDAVFEHLPRDVGAVLRVGKENAYTILNTVGGDVRQWFRNTLLDAIVEELPVQGAGSLAERIAVSGRIRPLTIQTKTGRMITRSIAARANAIARVECAKVMNSVHQSLCSAALGDEAVYVNDNPMDDRTTEICMAASQQPPMTLEEWSASPFGRPPRLRPFHLCRSVLLGGREEWFADRFPARAKPKPKAPAKPKAPKASAASRAPAGGPTPEELAALRAEQEATAADTTVPIGRRLQAYGKSYGVDDLAALRPLEPKWTALQPQLQVHDTELRALAAEHKAMMTASYDPVRVNAFHLRRQAWEKEEKALESAQLKLAAAAHKRLALGTSAKVSSNWPAVAVSKSWVPTKVIRATEKAEAWYRAMLGDTRWSSPLAVDYRFWPNVTRASADCLDLRPLGTHLPSGWAPNWINLGPKTEVRAVVHETGHQLEFELMRRRVANGMAADCSASPAHLGYEFLQYRIKTSPKQAAQVTAFRTKFQNSGYDPSERGCRDRFFKAWMQLWHDRGQAMRSAYYTGKDYSANDASTEVLSMGAELLWRDPIGFARADPEFFHFIRGIFRGVLW